MFGPCEKALIVPGVEHCSYRQVWNAIAQDSPVAVCIVGVDGRWIYPHQRIAQWLGYEINELEALDFQTITHPDDLRTGLANVQRLINREANYYQMEKRYIAKDGAIVWVRLTVTALVQDDSVVGFVSQIENIQGQKEQEQKLKELTLTDPLTGLGNRRLFEKELERHWQILQRYGIPFALIMIDFNNFKSINSAYSHAGGDAVLKDGADRLRSVVRAESVVSRQGGDELAVIMPCSPDIENAIAETEITCDRITKALDAVAHCCCQDIPYSCSVGGAVCTPDLESLEQLYILADERMMARKRVRV